MYLVKRKETLEGHIRLDFVIMSEKPSFILNSYEFLEEIYL